MLQITRRADYALIALADLAGRRGDRASVRELAATYSLSQPLLANVLKALAREELVRSVRGTKGGYELAVAPEALPVGRVLELLEGPLRLTECADDDEGGRCAATPCCPVRHGMHRLHERMRELLWTTSLADLARGGRPLPCASACDEERPA